MHRQKQTKQQGFIALIAMLIVASAGLVIGLSVASVGLNELKTGLGGYQTVKARALTQTCVEEGLERLRGDFVNYSGSLSVGSGSCIIDIAVTGSNAQINATGTVDVYNQKIEVEVDNNLDVVSWQED